MKSSSEELFTLIQEKHGKAINESERIVVKWLGWLIFFLSMHRNRRVEFARNELEVNATIKQLTKDLDELGKRSIASDDKTVEINRRFAKRVLRKTT